MVINQPMSQIRLTNVSLVRLKKGKKRFEVACYQNKVQDYRSGVEKDLDEVLQIPRVFFNVSKGLVAPNEDLQKAFGTTDTDKVVLEILSKGEIQLGEKERQLNIQNINKEILTIISTKCINPKSRKRYPPSIINKVLAELNYNVLPNKSAKSQALEIIKLLIAKQIIPIARAKMRVRIVWNGKEAKKNMEKIKELFNETESEDYVGNEMWECHAVIDPVNYKPLVELVAGDKVRQKGSIEVLEMAVVGEGDTSF
ncbi:guanine nucleotide exchange factor [Saccharomycopsis crataegensis]|uniref:Ribosome maturation protein SDO1 n=1 Tax=Saccharomycopsis crataegensis TaxID=43959 RepID=A0AAV5QJL2_9ASCO|nr:guanine nucleotide exchange factor [Saccharomycopsis crataegensis]